MMAFYFKKQKMKNNIINDPYSDYHIHSLFSDWVCTIEEITQFAGILWMKEIAITDHSDQAVKVWIEQNKITPGWWARYSLNNWENVRNDVKVIFWVEWDLLNENGDVCLDSQWHPQNFTILSVHRRVYESDPITTWKWFLAAIEKFHDKIDFVWHPYSRKQNWEFIDIKALVDLCNQYDIPIEFNHSVLESGDYIEENLIYVLKNAKKIYVNSDAHNLAQLKQLRKSCYNFLENM
jgi:histidinol phosphatase-like PHP family hydrolase